jgi:hypothetical protein
MARDGRPAADAPGRVPFISAAIYEERLESFADCANQRIDAPRELAPAPGSGTFVQQESAECRRVTGTMPGRARVQPELLHIRCRSAEQMRLLNALLFVVEMAGEAGQQLIR